MIARDFIVLARRPLMPHTMTSGAESTGAPAPIDAIKARRVEEDYSISAKAGVSASR